MVPRYLLNVSFFLPGNGDGSWKSPLHVRRRLEAVARIPSVNQPARGIFSPMFPRPECHADVHIKSARITIWRTTYFCQSNSSPHFHLEQLGHTSCDNSVTGIDRPKGSNCWHTDSARGPQKLPPWRSPAATALNAAELLQSVLSIPACPCGLQPVGRPFQQAATWEKFSARAGKGNAILFLFALEALSRIRFPLFSGSQ